jgi:hypothetical protein
MFFMPRLNPLIALALVTALILTLVLDLDEIVYALSGILWVFLMLSILFKPV